VTVQIANAGRQSLDLRTTVVNLTASNGDPGAGMSGPPADPVSGRLPPGRRASGVYVFAVPPTQRDPVTIEVSVSPDMPTAVFRGTP